MLASSNVMSGEGGESVEEIVINDLAGMDIDEVFEQIMTEYGQDILNLTYSYVKNIAVAEDLTQEIFVKCYLNLASFKQEASFRTWLWRIAINHCKDFLKSWHHRNVLLSTKADIEVEARNNRVEDIVIEKDETNELEQAILALPLKYREPIYLFYYQDLSIKEIKEILGVRENTIKTRLRRAKVLLKNHLEG